MKTSYIDYAMSVIVGARCPDVRDGLKPVHRRILYAMKEMGLRHRLRPTRKARAWSETCSANTTRTATSRFTMRWSAWCRIFRCATRWWMARGISALSTAIRRRPCVTPKSAWPPSPTRCSADIDKETVDFAPNYDGSMVEPIVLPAKLPSLLVNRIFRDRGRHGDEYAALRTT